MCKGSILETVPQHTVRKSYVLYSSGGYFHQSCHVTKARVSASTDANVDKLAEFFVEKVEGVRAAAAAIVCSP